MGILKTIRDSKGDNKFPRGIIKKVCGIRPPAQCFNRIECVTATSKKTMAVSQMGVPLDDRSIEPLHGVVEMHVHADGLYINEIRKK